MKNKRLQQQKIRFVNAGFMDLNDELVDDLPCSYAENQESGIKRWKSGWLYYTKRRMICMSGMTGNPIVIEYADICNVRKCLQGLLPMGIVVTYRNFVTGNIEERRFSMAQRKKWISFLQENRMKRNGEYVNRYENMHKAAV